MELFFQKKNHQKVCYFNFYLYLCTRNRPDGGIGRRAGLKHQWSNPSRFDPGSGYKELQVFTCGSFLCKHHRPDGGIGRRAGLKHQWGNPSRFDPGSGYKELQVFTCGSFFCLIRKRASPLTSNQN